MSELKSCPFCGGEAVYMRLETIYWDGYQVMCAGQNDGDCAGLNGSSKYDTKEEANEAWNRRANVE